MDRARPRPKAERLSSKRTCPVCGGEERREDRPFCSKRCADVDLGRWLKGGYAIAGDPVSDASEGDGSSGEA